MRAFCLFAVLVSLAVPRPARAEAPTARLTLNEALARAEARSPDLASARDRVSVQRAELDALSALRKPTFSAFATVVGASVNNTTTNTLGVAGVDYPRIGATVVNGDIALRPYASTMLAAGGRQLLSDFGRTDLLRDSAARRIPVATGRAETVRLDARAEAADAFFAVLAAEAVERVAEQAAARARSRRDLVSASAAAGMFPPVAKTLAEADVARFELARVRAGGVARTARTMLAAATASEAAEVGAREPETTAPSLPSENDVRARAGTTHPAIRAAQAEVAARQAATRAQAAMARPTLFLTGGLSTRAGGAPATSGDVLAGDGFLPFVPNYHVGVVLSAPLYDPVVKARTDVARAEERVAQHEAESVRLRTIARALRARTDAEIADAQMDALLRSLEASTKNFEQADTRFRAGIGTATELADAESRRVEAEIQLAVGTYDRLRARALLERAVGGFDP